MTYTQDSPKDNQLSINGCIHIRRASLFQGGPSPGVVCKLHGHMGPGEMNTPSKRVQLLGIKHASLIDIVIMK